MLNWDALGCFGLNSWGIFPEGFRDNPRIPNHQFTISWFNPFQTYQVDKANRIISPSSRVKIRNHWNHHLVAYCQPWVMPRFAMKLRCLEQFPLLYIPNGNESAWKGYKIQFRKLAGAQPPPYCSCARYLVAHLLITEYLEDHPN